MWRYKGLLLWSSATVVGMSTLGEVKKYSHKSKMSPSTRIGTLRAANAWPLWHRPPNIASGFVREGTIGFRVHIRSPSYTSLEIIKTRYRGWYAAEDNIVMDHLTGCFTVDARSVPIRHHLLIKVDSDTHMCPLYWSLIHLMFETLSVLEIRRRPTFVELEGLTSVGQPWLFETVCTQN